MTRFSTAPAFEKAREPFPSLCYDNVRKSWREYRPVPASWFVASCKGLKRDSCSNNLRRGQGETPPTHVSSFYADTGVYKWSRNHESKLTSIRQILYSTGQATNSPDRSRSLLRTRTNFTVTRKRHEGYGVVRLSQLRFVEVTFLAGNCLRESSSSSSRCTQSVFRW